MYYTKTVKSFVIVLLIAFASSFAYGQTPIDYDKMERDLSIMEKVLETVLAENDIKTYFRVSRIKGVFLDNYGVVFMMNASTRNYRDEKAIEAKDAFEKMREELTAFLTDYAAVIKQLRPDDWVTLVINMSEDNVFTYETGFVRALPFERREREEKEKEEFRPHPFIMTVKKSEIDRARSGAGYDLRNVVTFTPIASDNVEYMSKAMNRDIKIMKSILETALESKLKVNLNADRFLGTYLKDYGVLFIVNSGSEIRIVMPERDYFFIEPNIAITLKQGVDLRKGPIISVRVNELEKRLQEAYEIQLEKLSEDLSAREREKQLESKKQDQERINNIVQSLTEVIGDYGFTIRDLDPNETIAVLYTSSSGYWGRTRGKFNLMLTATYRDIIEYSRGVITLETFKSRVRASTFD